MQQWLWIPQPLLQQLRRGFGKLSPCETAFLHWVGVEVGLVGGEPVVVQLVDV